MSSPEERRDRIRRAIGDFTNRRSKQEEAPKPRKPSRVRNAHDALERWERLERGES